MLLSLMTCTHPAAVRLGEYLDEHPTVTMIAVLVLLVLGGLVEGAA